MPKALESITELAPKLWFCTIHRVETDAHTAIRLLTDPEKQFFAHDRVAARRDLRILARATLRKWLGSLLDKPALEVPLQTSPTGRPVLSLPAAPWTFSTSTRGDIALLAMASADWGEIGIDIEKAKPDVDIALLTAPAFTSAELARLGVESFTQRETLALRLWVRKEAVAKALGLGAAAFDAGLDLSTLDWAESPEWQEFTTLGHRCRLRDLPPLNGYVAALALADTK